ncbi:MAG: hypothetical protein AAFZ07_12865 [Actinomycetota bacterium]
MRGGVGLVVIVVLTALFSLGWFALMAVVHSLSIGPGPVVFAAGLLAGSFLFGVFVSLVRDRIVPELVHR